MTAQNRAIFVVSLYAIALSFVLFYMLKARNGPEVIYNNPQHAPVVLNDGEKAKTVVEKSKAQTATKRPNGQVAVTTQYIPPEGSVTVTQPATGGDIDVRVKDKGFTLSPGVGVGLVGTRPGGFVFVKVAYWRRLGLCGGVGFNSAGDIVPYGGLSYHIMSNTFLHAGAGSEAKIVAGLSLRF